MPEAQSNIATHLAQKSGQVVLTGKLREIEKLPKGGYRFLLVQPAADSYAYPKSFPIFGEAKPGNSDEVVTLRCELSSYAKRITNKETGELVTIHNIGLRVV